jgi:1-acyl-sn-glycerol-3-phosphate acyltransferase
MAQSEILSAKAAETFGLRELRGARRAMGLVLITAGLVAEGLVEPIALPRALAHRAQRTARRLLDLHGVDVRCADPPPRAPAILVSNHLSYLDPLVIAAVAPCISIAKQETNGWPLIGAGLRALGVVFVRRGDAHSGAVALRRAKRAVESGAMALNFPEGTTGDGSALAPFCRGIFGLAALTGVPVVPAHVSYDDPRVRWFGDEKFVPHYRELSRIARIDARIRFGAPITVQSDDDPRVIADRARGVVATLALNR